MKINENLNKKSCILYINGFRHWFIDDNLDIYGKDDKTTNILNKYGDDIIYSDINWKSKELLVNRLIDKIKKNNVKAIVGFSAGGYLSYYLSNKFKIPALSINPAMAFTSAAPDLQPISPAIKYESVYPNQIVVIGDKDSKENKGVDGKLVLDMLERLSFERKGGEILILKNTQHLLTEDQFENIFDYFYKKFIYKKNNENLSNYMDNDILVDKFKKFLMDNFAYNKYLSNLKKYGKLFKDIRCLNKLDSNIFLTGSFSFENTPEKEIFWNKLNMKWQKEIRKNKYLKENVDIDPFGEEDWNEYDYKELFIKFLKDNGAYDEFVENLNNNLLNLAIPRKITIDEYLNDMYGYIYNKRSYVSAAFIFVNTKQGKKYWDNLNFMWRELARHA